MRRLIAALGGTFDPIHHGHLRAALEVREALDADRVLLVPCADPPHRPAPAVSAERRADWIEAVLGDIPHLAVDRRELARSGPSYTVDTLASLRAEYGPDCALVWVVGSDAYAGLMQWHRWEELTTLAHLLVLTRPPLKPPPELLLQRHRQHRRPPSALREAPGGYVAELAITPLDISASRIRTLVASGRSVRFLVPDLVAAAIEQHGFYRR